MKAESNNRVKARIVLVLNIILIVFFVSHFFIYNEKYNDNIRNQNLTSISNLTQSSSELFSKFYISQQSSLKNISQYIRKRALTLEELLDFLHDYNATSDSIYEVIGSDNCGYLVRKNDYQEYIGVQYSSNDYKALQSIFQNISPDKIGMVQFTPEFTDDYTAMKCFALYTLIPIYQEDGSVSYYTLMSLSRSQEFMDMIQICGNYKEMSTVLCDSSGDYIISNPDFKSDNFFQYIYSSNGLTLDQKRSLTQDVLSSRSGTLFYRNSKKEDCTYIYQSVSNGSWYVITCTPLDSFQTIRGDLHFTLYIVISIGIMFAIDVIWLRSLNRQLKLSMVKERMANNAKTDFLSRMSHDIRTPLNAVIGFCELAKYEPEVSVTMMDYLNNIHTSGKYLLCLVNDILDMSKIESNKMELHETLVNESEFLSNIAATFAAQAKAKEITLKTDFTKAQVNWIYMDELRSRQIYSNLLNNALKFSESGTSVSWQIRQEIISDEELEMICVISDEGCGMSEEFMKHIFQPFEQDYNRYTDKEGGTGLGLSIVKQLVNLMGGSISVESELGKGSTFTIHMKQRFGMAPVETIPEENEDIKTKYLEGRRILLCEDQPLNQQIVMKILNKKDILVELADNGEIGVNMFKKAPSGYYDAILMDIRMPVMNGWDAAKEIRSLDKSDATTVPIIAITANAFEDDIQRSTDVGMNAHIAKPVSPDELFDTLLHQIH